MERKQAQVLGYNVDLFSFNDVISYSEYLLDSEYSAHVVTINPEMIEFAQKNEDFSEIINSAQLIVPDGTGIKIALAVNGIKQERVPGIEYSKKILQYCETSNIPVALIGSTKQVLEKTIENLKKEMPNLNIVFSQDGFFQSEQEAEIVDGIKQSGARFVLVALGSPKQEFFIDNCRKIIKNALWVGVGGSFDVWSGMVKRAPVIYRRLGLEWLYRVIDNPKRLNRIFPTLPRFMIKVIMNKIKFSKKVKNG